MYAWNEYDEGGWIAPTRSSDGTPDMSRLDAVRHVLTKSKNAQQGGGGRQAARSESK